jgi:ABC-type transport system involved in multi-copper enzyme maturation permease subunit
MKNIFVISQNTFLELVRNRVLYMFLFFAVFLLFLMLALGQLSFTEQFRLSISLGLACIHMCLVASTIFIGGSIVYKEIDRLTILTVLVRPLSRPQFLVGKYLGFLQLMFCFNFGFFFLYVLSLLFMGFSFNYSDIFLVFLGFAIEIMILLAVTLFFSTFSASFLTIVFTICFFIIGHCSEALSQLVVSTAHQDYIMIAKVVNKVLPNLELFNWRLQPVDAFLQTSYVLKASAISLAWSVFFLFAAALVFRKRDFA